LNSASVVVVLVAFCASTSAAPLGSPSPFTPPITLAAAPLFAIPVDLRTYGIPADIPELILANAILPGAKSEPLPAADNTVPQILFASLAGATCFFSIIPGIALWQQRQSQRKSHSGVKVKRERRTMAFI
jgi:hypothetical protein